MGRRKGVGQARNPRNDTVVRQGSQGQYEGAEMSGGRRRRVVEVGESREKGRRGEVLLTS